jgi:hypothetical protein
MSTVCGAKVQGRGRVGAEHVAVEAAMAVELAALCKGLAAGSAGEGLLARVHTLMLLQTAPQGKHLATLALVRPCAGVGLLVGSEIAPCSEFFAALVAAVRPLASMRAQVSL